MSGKTKKVNWGRKIRKAQEKGDFLPYEEPVLGTRKRRFLTVEGKNGGETLAGYYDRHVLEIQNERQLGEATCKNYDNVIFALIAPAFSKYGLRTMDELEFLECWSHVERTARTPAQLKVAYTMVRIIADHAYRNNAMQISLWGVISESRKSRIEHERVLTAKEIDAEEAKRLADRGIRIARSISQETEFKLFLLMLQQAADCGQVLAGMLIFLTGARTSEALAFKYKHLVEVTPGYWGLQRLEVSGQNTRESDLGGKTHNAYRLLWVANFMARLLLERKKFLEQRYSAEEVAEFPIACYGRNYRCQTTQKELNAHMKDLFRKAGVKEDMIASAFEDIREGDDGKEYERSIVAYLGRHQAITAMVYCGLSEGEIAVCAGHKQIDPHVQAYDFVNPDRFRELARVLSRRPIVQILDGYPEETMVQVTSGEKSFSGDGWIRLAFETAQNFSLFIESCEVMLPVEIERMAGIQVLNQESFWLDRLPGRSPISIRKALREKGEKAYRAVKESFEAPAAAGTAAIEDLEWIESGLDERLSVVESLGQEELPETGRDAFLENFVTGRETAVPEGSGKEGNGFRQGAMTWGAQELSENEKNESNRADAKKDKHCLPDNVHLYLLAEDGGITNIEREDKVLRKRGTKGKKLGTGALFAYDPQKPLYVVSKEGRFYCGPKERIAWERAGEESTAWFKRLREDGHMLQWPQDHRKGVLACLLSDGRVAFTSSEVLSKAEETGVALLGVQGIARYAGAKIVSVCFVPAGRDLLLVTRRGKGLRIAGEYLPYYTDARKAIRGIRIAEGDAALACLPYTEEGVLCITAYGRAILLQNMEELHRFDVGRKGVALLKLQDQLDDKLVAALTPNQAVALLRQDGYMSCMEVSEFPRQSRNGMGVLAMKTEHRRLVSGAVSLDMESRKREWSAL